MFGGLVADVFEQVIYECIDLLRIIELQGYLRVICVHQGQFRLMNFDEANSAWFEVVPGHEYSVHSTPNIERGRPRIYGYVD
jgi:hypothetical protein